MSEGTEADLLRVRIGCRRLRRARVAEMRFEAVIPCNPTRKRPIPYDFEAYKIRNLVEIFFNRIQHFRRIATRYDRCASYFLRFVQLASAMIWMR